MGFSTVVRAIPVCHWQSDGNVAKRTIDKGTRRTDRDCVMSIIISKQGKDAQRLERTVIPQEEYLQQYILDNPDSLPLHELKADIQLLIVDR